MSGLPHRNDVPIEETWDLSHLFADEAAYEASLDEWVREADRIVDAYQGKLEHSEDVEQLVALAKERSAFRILGHKLSNYAMLPVNVDITDPENLRRSGQFSTTANQVFTKLSFIDSELQTVSDAVLEAARDADEETARYFALILRNRPHQLHPEVEKALVRLSDALNLPYDIYHQAKLSDLQFESFEANGRTYPNSFVLFENDYNEQSDLELRRKGFESFSKDLRRIRATVSTGYIAQVKTEKALSEMQGFDSVIDSLLFPQEVSRELYDRQIDGIMTHLAPIMRKYAKLLKQVHKLDAIHYADLKMALDPETNPKVSIDRAWAYAKDGLALLGEDYGAMIEEAKKGRWIDFAQNQGKSTGGFCTSPYQSSSNILLNWNGNLSEVFTMVHELGHAGHFQLAGQHQSYDDYEVSMYVVEAPSTCNELILGHYLREQFKDDPKKRRWVIASQISNTYYHNFVTHLLEADYQRKVYQAIDRHEALQADDLDRLYRETLETFWGDTVVLDEGAELTWMRQPHYYMGLYPYTYSAGLTIATAWNHRLEVEGPAVAEDWLQALRAGGSVDVEGFAALAGVDITTDQALTDAIAYVGSLVDELWTLSETLGEI